jgi:hypothetical protein
MAVPGLTLIASALQAEVGHVFQSYRNLPVAQ